MTCNRLEALWRDKLSSFFVQWIFIELLGYMPSTVLDVGDIYSGEQTKYSSAGSQTKTRMQVRKISNNCYAREIRWYTIKCLGDCFWFKGQRRPSWRLWFEWQGAWPRENQSRKHSGWRVEGRVSSTKGRMILASSGNRESVHVAEAEWENHGRQVWAVDCS